MSNVIVALPKQEAAQKIRKILGQSGYEVAGVCTTGAQALEKANRLEEGILICGCRFVDMMYTEVQEYLPSGFQMLLLASPASLQERETDVVCLAMPLKVHELLQTLEMMESEIRQAKKRKRQRPAQRTNEEQKIIESAKALLMERNGFTEAEAHRYIQKRSMENGVGLAEVAQMTLSIFG